MKKTFRMTMLIWGVLLAAACSRGNAIAPRSDCMDVPCVPCVLPFPLFSGEQSPDRCMGKTGETRPPVK
jgi:hypothetical protein